MDTNLCNKENTGNACKSQYSNLYKTSTEVPFDQNKRRLRLLEEQKRRRNDALDEIRGIQDIVEEEGENSPPKRKYKRPDYEKYKNKIMYSEWLMEIPPDFDVLWFIKFCPNGHRNLVVANSCTTKSFSKTGRFEYEFKSALPGGSDVCKGKTTILDCIWNGATRTFYILDVLMWASYNLTDKEAELRFFWLNSKMMEYPELEIQSTYNYYKFKYVPHFSCDYLVLKDSLEKYPFYEKNLPKIDGLLFYHKEASYTAGSTPLVGWLKPYMVPEILNVHVASQYLVQKPSKYVNLIGYIQYIAQKKNKDKNIEQMEISEEVSNFEELNEVEMS